MESPELSCVWYIKKISYYVFFLDPIYCSFADFISIHVKLSCSIYGSRKPHDALEQFVKCWIQAILDKYDNDDVKKFLF